MKRFENLKKWLDKLHNMPYDTKAGTGKDKGKTCVFKKNGGAKVGCTAGSVKKYLAALHVNANESLTKDVLMGLIEEILEEEYQLEAKTKTSPTGREETPCKGRGCVTKERPEITDYAKDIGKEMKSGKIKKTYIDKKTGKRKETNKYALATHAAKQSGSMRGKDFARKVPKNVNPKTGAKKKSLDEKELEEKRRKPYDKAHGRKYKSEVGTKKQDERNQRKRDKEKHDKENGKCPSGQELHHTKGLKSSSVKCEPVSKNRGRKEKSRLKKENKTTVIGNRGLLKEASQSDIVHGANVETLGGMVDFMKMMRSKGRAESGVGQIAGTIADMGTLGTFPLGKWFYKTYVKNEPTSPQEVLKIFQIDPQLAAVVDNDIEEGFIQTFMKAVGKNPQIRNIRLDDIGMSMNTLFRQYIQMNWDVIVKKD